MRSHSMIYVGIYALIYLHTILGEGIVSRDGLPRGVLPSGILKMEKYCPDHKVPVSYKKTLKFLKKSLNFLKKILNFLKKTLNFPKKTLIFLKNSQDS